MPLSTLFPGMGVVFKCKSVGESHVVLSSAQILWLFVEPVLFITGYCKLDHSDRQTEEWNMRPDTPSKEIYLSNVEWFDLKILEVNCDIVKKKNICNALFYFLVTNPNPEQRK